MGQKLAVVVTGGTGKQGGAVVKSLLERGHQVCAVTRSTDSAKARELANAGVTLVRASLEDTAALTKALEGATSLFAMTTPFEGGTQVETRQGISAADAAEAAGVHLVFTSVGSANRQTGVPHFDSKYEVGVLAAIPLTWRWKLQAGTGVDLTPSMHWPAPLTAHPIDHDRGPVLVTIEYRIRPQDRHQFLQTLE
jgi:nucleoside-diphosphate-sugar epimerase